MPYIESICKAGKTIEVERYYTSRYGCKGQKRSDKVKPTPEEQKKINDKLAEKKLRRLINENFSAGDYHLVLSYQKKKGEPNRDPEDMKEDIRKFLRTLRKEYKLQGQDLKYIHVAEVGQRGARHHHLILNAIPPDTIQGCWPHGRIHINPLDFSGNYRELASYLVKQTSKLLKTEAELQGKRWNSSKNLRHPEPEKRIITERAWYRSEAKVPAKYRGRYVIDPDSISMGVTSAEYYGYGYFRFTMVMLC
jgi:hypothetical protein